METAWSGRADERHSCKIEEDRDDRGGARSCVAQGNPQADLSTCGSPTQAGAELQKAPQLQGN